jgi:two-component system sensor histidine kinase RegB
LGALAAGFSHEFSSPLQTIKLRLARLERNEQSEDLKEALGAIEQCELVIKQMNSAQLDPREFQWKSVNLSELTSDILGFWQEAHPSARIVAKIQPNCRAILPPLNYAQAVQNLLDNAFEANPKEAIAVHLSESQDKFVLEISDGGPGFSNLVFEKIGEPFVTTKESGTGLGLYIADLLAKSLGGQLLLANIPQGGAKVTLSWPVNRRQNE